jgi:septal ring factor EnvC (AmiA/AmiB activator)
LILVAGTAAVAASAPLPRQDPAIDSQLQQARNEAAAATAEQHRLEKAAAAARDEVTRLHAEQLAAAQAIEAAEARITAADAEARLAQAMLEAQRQRLAAEQAPVSSLLGGLILAARRPPLLMLADSGSTEELVKLRLLVRATAPAIRAKTSGLTAELERESSLEQQAAAARQRMVDSRNDLGRRSEALAALEQRAVELARNRGAQALGAGDVALVSEERLSTVEQGAQSAAQSRLLGRELAALGPAPIPAAASAPSNPQLAYRLPAQAPVTDGMGAVSPNGVRSRGVTLATRRGTPLSAPASGTILFAGPFRDYDGIVIIDHGDGWKSVIVNAGSKLRKGMNVRIGDRLGVALGPVEVQLQHGGQPVSPALIAGSSEVLSNGRKGG